MIMFKLYILFSCMSFMNSKTEIHSFTVTLCCKSWFDQYTLSRVTMLKLCASLLVHPMKPSCSIESLSRTAKAILPGQLTPHYQNYNHQATKTNKTTTTTTKTTTTTIILYVVCRDCYVLKQIYKFELS